MCQPVLVLPHSTHKPKHKAGRVVNMLGTKRASDMILLLEMYGTPFVTKPQAYTSTCKRLINYSKACV